MAVVIFDCDGVLMNTDQISSAVGHRVLADHGIPCAADDYLNTYLGHTLTRFIDIAGRAHHAKFGTSLPVDFRQKTIDIYLAQEAVHLRAVDGVIDLITRLRQDTKIGVASNSNQDSLERKLRLTGLYNLFRADWIVSNAAVEQPKPAPDIYLHTMRLMGESDPRRCLVVDDSVIGVTAAAAAGMHVIGFTGGGLRLENHAQALKNAGAADVVDTMPEIWAHLRRHINRIRQAAPGPAPAP